MLRKVFGQLKGDGLGARAGRGSILVVTRFGAENLIRLLSNLVLTRLLFPEAFALMALVQIVTSGLMLLTDAGIRASLIQNERGDDPSFINTAWTLQVIRGTLVSAVAALLAPVAAQFYEEPLLAELLPVAALSAFLTGLMPTRLLTASRHLMIGRVTFLTIFELITTAIMTIFLAWWLESVWALVFGILAGGIWKNIVFRVFMPGIQNRFHLEKAAIKDLIGFGKFVVISTFATFLVNNADRALLGKFLSLESLGIYVIALALASVPQLMARQLAVGIVFPLYSRRKPHESQENYKKLSKARLLLSGTVFLSAFILVLVGDPLVRFLYDARYDTAGAITVIVVIGFLPQIVVSSYDSVLLANSRSDLHAVSNVALAVIKVSLLYFGIKHFGILGAALVPAVATILHYPLLVFLIKPYSAWDPKHDILFFALCGVIAWIAWMISGDNLMQFA